jgi:hypothetical protein
MASSAEKPYSAAHSVIVWRAISRAIDSTFFIALFDSIIAIELSEIVIVVDAIL